MVFRSLARLDPHHVIVTVHINSRSIVVLIECLHESGTFRNSLIPQKEDFAEQLISEATIKALLMRLKV